MPADVKSIAVLGAGVTALVAAHRLVKEGHQVRIFEQSGRAGGVVRTEEANGWLIESGPNSVLGGEPALTHLLRELDLAELVIRANPRAKNRYVVRRDRLVPVPLSPPAFFTSSLFSPWAKLRILSETLARPRTRIGDVSLAQFVREHFGTEFVDYALTPFVGGVYAGNPERLSARYAFPKLWEMERSHGSLIRSQAAAARERRALAKSAPEIISFPHGLQTLTDKIVGRLRPGGITFNVSLEAITPGEKWNVIWNDGGATLSQAFDTVVLALPAHALARLRIGSLGERPLASLAQVEHPPLSSLFLGYPREHVLHPMEGLGLLIPAIENRTPLGVLFSSTLFPGRAPPGHVALTVMIGGTRQPELAALPQDQLLDRVRPDLAQLLGVRGQPTFMRHTFWPQAIPQYNLGHEQHIACMAFAEQSHPGLYIGGQVRDGISLPACVAAGEKLAARVIG